MGNLEEKSISLSLSLSLSLFIGAHPKRNGERRPIQHKTGEREVGGLLSRFVFSLGRRRPSVIAVRSLLRCSRACCVTRVDLVVVLPVDQLFSFCLWFFLSLVLSNSIA